MSEKASTAFLKQRASKLPGMPKSIGMPNAPHGKSQTIGQHDCKEVSATYSRLRTGMRRGNHHGSTFERSITVRPLPIAKESRFGLFRLWILGVVRAALWREVHSRSLSRSPIDRKYILLVISSAEMRSWWKPNQSIGCNGYCQSSITLIGNWIPSRSSTPVPVHVLEFSCLTSPFDEQGWLVQPFDFENVFWKNNLSIIW